MVINSLFEAAKLTKNADLDKYQYSGYGTGFDPRNDFSLINSNNWDKYELICAY